MTRQTSKHRAVSHNRSHNGQHATDLKGVVHDAKAALATPGGQITHEVHALRDRLSGSLDAFRSKAKALAKAARVQAARADTTIRANPYQAIGIAAGTGLIAGYLIARRRSGS